VRQPERNRPFRTPLIWFVGPLALFGCAYLFYSLSAFTQLAFLAWAVIGLFIYRFYGYRRSALATPAVVVRPVTRASPGA
jgi:APA family basic amino acid/polyamine antiporter